MQRLSQASFSFISALFQQFCRKICSLWLDSNSDGRGRSQAIWPVEHQPENTHLLCKGKYQFTAVLLFVWFRFSYFACVELETFLLVCLNPNQSNRRSAVQWYFPLQSNWVFSAFYQSSRLTHFDLPKWGHITIRTKRRAPSGRRGERFSFFATNIGETKLCQFFVFYSSAIIACDEEGGGLTWKGKWITKVEVLNRDTNVGKEQM